MRRFKAGERVSVRGRGAVYVKTWGAGAVVRFDDQPTVPKVVPLDRVEPETRPERRRAARDAPPGAPKRATA